MAKERKIEVRVEDKPRFTENVDPLTTGKTMYGEDVKGASTFVGRQAEAEGMAPMPASKVANADREDQDEVAAGRTEPIARG